MTEARLLPSMPWLKLCCSWRCHGKAMLLLAMPLLIESCYWRWHYWRYAATGDVIGDAVLILALLMLCCWHCRCYAVTVNATVDTMLTLLMVCCRHCWYHAATAAVVADPMLLLSVPLLTLYWHCYCPFWFTLKFSSHFFCNFRQQCTL